MKIITWGSLFGLMFLVLFFIPNLIHYIRRPGERIMSGNKVMRTIEWIGGAASLILTIFWFSSRKWGFYSLDAALCYVLGSVILILLNWVLWIVYFFMTRPFRALTKDGATAVFVASKKEVRSFVIRPLIVIRITFAVLPVLLFLLHGITLRYVPLIISGVLFGVGHIFKAFQHKNYGEK